MTWRIVLLAAALVLVALEPVGEVQKAFDEVRRLPRKQQRKVVEMVTAFVEMYKRKAS